MAWWTRLFDLTEDWRYLWHHAPSKRVAGREIAADILALPYRRLRLLVVARALTDPLPVVSPKIPLTIRPFTATDLAFVERINRPSERQLCRRRFDLGHHGLVAEVNGQVAGYAWGAPRLEPELDGAPLELAAGDIFCVDVYTQPSFRNQGIQTALTLARFELFRQLGYQRAVAYISQTNAPSLAVWRKVGSEVIGEIHFTRFGPWRWTKYVPAAV